MLMHCRGLFKPVIILIIVNLAMAIVNLLMKKVLSGGMDNMSIVTYRQAVSFIFMAPIACLYERKHKLEAHIICLLFLSSLVGRDLESIQYDTPSNDGEACVILVYKTKVTLTQYIFLLGLEYTSATFSCAFLNAVPVFTFIVALPFGIEKVNITSKSGKAKIFGTVVCIGGTLVLILYKGMPLINPQAQHTANEASSGPPARKLEKWIIGSIFLITGCLLWSSWFIIQAKISKRYPCQYSSTAILSLFSAIQSAILTLIIKGNNASWILKGNLEIMSVIYAGLVGSGLCYVAMSWCVKQRGPVFTSAFTPLVQIFVAVLDFSILKEEIYLGSVVGSALVITGLYILLWGKSNENAPCVKDAQASQQDVELQ